MASSGSAQAALRRAYEGLSSCEAGCLARPAQALLRGCKVGQAHQTHARRATACWCAWSTGRMQSTQPAAAAAQAACAASATGLPPSTPPAPSCAHQVRPAGGTDPSCRAHGLERTAVRRPDGGPRRPCRARHGASGRLAAARGRRVWPAAAPGEPREHSARLPRAVGPAGQGRRRTALPLPPAGTCSPGRAPRWLQGGHTLADPTLPREPAEAQAWSSFIAGSRREGADSPAGPLEQGATVCQPNPAAHLVLHARELASQRKGAGVMR